MSTVQGPAAPAPATTAPAPKAPPTPHTVLAPIAGTVQEVFVKAGAAIEASAPVVLIDAMMMDTCIYAPTGGLVTEVAVAPGDIVQAGDDLVRYLSEA
jgi:biotin carboxyl carrier protein